MQAGLRTDYLFRLANQRGGIVLGTGDLSELALGWCTYGVGDQMSHYNVNAGVPKTLIQHLIRWVIASRPVRRRGRRGAAARSSTPEITPELVPTEEDEETAGDRGHGRPLRAAGLHALPRAALRLPADQDRLPGLARLARPSAGDWPPGFPESKRPSPTTSRRSGTGCEVFVQRFFASQFKRSALPNGPKVVAGGSLSPRGDWRAPSDARQGLAGRARAGSPRGLSRR